MPPGSFSFQPRAQLQGASGLGPVGGTADRGRPTLRFLRPPMPGARGRLCASGAPAVSAAPAAMWSVRIPGLGREGPRVWPTSDRRSDPRPAHRAALAGAHPPAAAARGPGAVRPAPGGASPGTSPGSPRSVAPGSSQAPLPGAAAPLRYSKPFAAQPRPTPERPRRSPNPASPQDRLPGLRALGSLSGGRSGAGK